MNTRKIRMAALIVTVGLSSSAEAALTWNGSAWTGTNYDNITVDNAYSVDGYHPTFSGVINYGTISLAAGYYLDFRGSNYGTIHSTSGLEIFGLENHGTLDGTSPGVSGSITNYQTVTLDSLGSGLVTNYGNLNVSALSGGELYNFGVANIGTISGGPYSYINNSATGVLTATSVDSENLINEGMLSVTEGIALSYLTNSGELFAGWLSMRPESLHGGYPSSLIVSAEGSLTTTGSVNLTGGWANGVATIDGVLTAGDGVSVGLLNPSFPYAGYTLWGTGVVNGDVFVSDTGMLYPELTINGTVYGEVYIPPPPIPEPETYAMMLAGLGLVGAMTRRRKIAKV